MKKKGLRLLSILIFVLLTTLLSCSLVFADDVIDSGSYSEDVTWVITGNENDMTLTISGSGAIPYNSVPWSGYRTKIKHIIVEEGINHIGDSAFYGCIHVKNVSLPDTVEIIGFRSFYNCTDLTDITIPGSVISVENYVFSGCTSLTNITFSHRSQELRFYNETFEKCTSLSNVYLDDIESWCLMRFDWNNATTTPFCYASHMFINDEEVTSITVPNGVTDIWPYAFYGCSNITSITLPESLEKIWFNSFTLCSSLESINIPEGVTEIGREAFNGCANLTNITLPNSLITIDDVSFSGCNNLTKLIIPESVVAINGFPFSSCPKICLYCYEDSYALSYAIEKNLNYKVLKAISDCRVDLLADTYEVTGDVILPDIKVYDGEQELLEGVHYTLEGLSANIGSGSACVKGLDNYIGETTVEFAIVDHMWESNYTTDRAATCTEDGLESIHCRNCNAVKESRAIPSLGHTWKIDYTVDKEATCIAEGSKSIHCTKCDEVKNVTSIPALGHDWSEPEWTWANDHSSANVKFTCKNDGTHVETVNATVTSAADESGDNTVYTAKATFNGKEYKDTVTEEIKPQASDERLYGKARYDTAIEAADKYKEATGSKFQNVIVAYGRNFPDALAGGYLAKVKNAPILLVEPSEENRIADYIKNNIASGGKVYLLGGTGVVSSAFEKKVKNKGIETERLGGQTRFDTNLAILDASGVTDEDILICTGYGYADSLSASAVGKPILLVGDTLTDAQKSYIKSLSSNQFYLIGGTGAVKPAIEENLKGLGYSKIDRLAGSTRYETSTAVAEKFFPKAKTVVLAYAQNFPDGLSGGPLAMKKNAPIILTATSNTAAAAKYVKTSGAASSITLGGPALISDAAVKAIMGR